MPLSNPVGVNYNTPVVHTMLSRVSHSHEKDRILIISPFCNERNSKFNVIYAPPGISFYKYINFITTVLQSRPCVSLEVHQDLLLASHLHKSLKKKIHTISLIKHNRDIVAHASISPKESSVTYYNAIEGYLSSPLLRPKKTNILLAFRRSQSKRYRKVILYASKNINIITVSKDLQYYYQQYFKSVHYIYNSYGYLGDLSSYTSTNNRKNVIAFVGKPTHEKGFVEFISSAIDILNYNASWSVHLMLGQFYHYKSHYNSEHHLHLYKSISQEPCFQQLVHDGRIKVDFALTSQEVFNNLLHYKISVVPSYDEAFGLSAMESMLAGCALILSNRGALLELINSEDMALILDDITPESITNCMQYLISNNQKRLKMASLAYEYAKEKFHPDIASTEFDSISGLLRL